MVSGAARLIGATGEVIEFSGGEGWATVDGERWQVRAGQPLQRGQRVRVTRVDGLTLEVTPAVKRPTSEGDPP